jgi:hypothetical protein
MESWSVSTHIRRRRLPTCTDAELQQEDAAEICCHIPNLKRLDVTYRSSYDIIFRSDNGVIPDTINDTSDHLQVEVPADTRMGKILNKISARCSSFTRLQIRCMRDFFPGGLVRKEDAWNGAEWEYCAKIDAKSGLKRWSWDAFRL